MTSNQGSEKLMTKPLGLFGLGTTSLGVFSEDYCEFFHRRNRRRKHPQTLPRRTYVPQFKVGLKPAEIYLIETVKNLIAVRSQLPVEAAVVVADSPLLLSELPGLQPLDWRRDAWRFKIQPVDHLAFETARLQAKKNSESGIWEAVLPVALDRLGLIIDETASGLIIGPFNTVVNQLNFLDRATFRQLAANYLGGKVDLSTFETTIKRLISGSVNDSKLILKSVAELITLLKTQGPVLQTAIACLLAKKSPNKHLKGTKISSFEIRYLTRLVSSHREKTKVMADA